MKSRIFVISLLLIPYSACVEIQTFPDNGSPAIYEAKEFFILSDHPEQYKGQPVRIAGRMVGIEEQDQGLLIIAEWLAFPKNPNLRPERSYTEEHIKEDNKKLRFFVFYSGTIESDFLWQGNEFLAIGETKGTQELINVVGTSHVVPYIETRCLHVWQTGSADLFEYTTAGPLTFRYPPPLERTYCLKPAKNSPSPLTNLPGN